jgi:molecular chaperone GrpE
MSEEERVDRQSDLAGEVMEAPEGAPEAAGADGAAEGEAVAALHPRIAELELQVAELERRVENERDAATDYMNRWQRAQADFANFKRRAQQEEQQREAFAAWRALAAMLPALDGMERAFATLPQALRTLSWIDGIALVHMQMSRALAAMNITPVAAEPGQPFDPEKHEAVGEVETGEQPAGAIAVVVQRGYEAAGVLLRPALVQVARQPQAQPDAPQAAQAEEVPVVEAEASPEAAAADGAP